MELLGTQYLKTVVSCEPHKGQWPWQELEGLVGAVDCVGVCLFVTAWLLIPSVVLV
jgi:hypothetical protein